MSNGITFISSGNGEVFNKQLHLALSQEFHKAQNFEINVLLPIVLIKTSFKSVHLVKLEKLKRNNKLSLKNYHQAHRPLKKKF